MGEDCYLYWDVNNELNVGERIEDREVFAANLKKNNEIKYKKK